MLTLNLLDCRSGGSRHNSLNRKADVAGDQMRNHLFVCVMPCLSVVHGVFKIHTVQVLLKFGHD